MGSPSPSLAARLARTGDLDEAVTLVLEQAVNGSGVHRAFVVFQNGDRYRALGFGHQGNGVRALERAASDPDTPLGAGLRTPGSGRVRVPEAAPSDVLLLRLGRSDSSWGAALVEADASESAVASFRGVFEEHAPELDRIRLLSELQRRAQCLSRDRELLTTIVNSLPDPVLLTNASNNILLANDRAEQLFATQPGDSDGRRRAIQLNNLLFSSFLTRSVISTSTAKPRELSLVHPTDGSDLLFEVLPAPVEREGMERSYLSILRNITDLKRALTELEAEFRRSRTAEERVRQEWERLNATLENVGDPILLTDDHSNIILMNREAELLFDPQRPEAAGPDRKRAVRANDMKLTSLISDFLLEPETRLVQTLDLQAPESGTSFTAEVVSSKILNARGEATAIVSVIHDLTQMVENERLARELRELNDQLEERIHLATVELEERNRRLEWQSQELERASRLKSNFLATMSHELRTPINAVIGYTSLLRDEIYGPLTDQQKRGLKRVDIATQHLLELINDILDLSKIEAGKMPVHLDDVSVPQVVGELTGALDPLVREKQLTLTVEVEKDFPTLFTDRMKLKQILLNLLSNAIKFTSEGGVTLRARPLADDRLRIDVSDTGIGIKAENLEAVFADFRQVDQSPTREYGGTGLGLTITRKLVALLNGRIQVESEYGVGSTFIVELPRRLEPGSTEEQLQRARRSDGSRAGEPSRETSERD